MDEQHFDLFVLSLKTLAGVPSLELDNSIFFVFVCKIPLLSERAK